MIKYYAESLKKKYYVEWGCVRILGWQTYYLILGIHIFFLVFLLDFLIGVDLFRHEIWIHLSIATQTFFLKRQNIINQQALISSGEEKKNKGKSVTTRTSANSLWQTKRVMTKAYTYDKPQAYPCVTTKQSILLKNSLNTL